MVRVEGSAEEFVLFEYLDHIIIHWEQERGELTEKGNILW